MLPTPFFLIKCGVEKMEISNERCREIAEETGLSPSRIAEVLSYVGIDVPNLDELAKKAWLIRTKRKID